MLALWIFCTSLAASGDRIAATDGTRVWISTDEGRSWRRAGAIPDEPDDLAPDEEPVHALAISGDDLLEGTPGGVWARPLGGGRAVLRSPVPVTALAATGGAIWAASDEAILRGDVGGRDLVRVAPLPDEPITGLAASGEIVLAATPADVWRWDGAWHRLGIGPAAVTAAGGTFFVATGDAVESSPDGDRWTPIATVGARLVAATERTIWIARGLHVGPLDDEPAVELDLPPRRRLDGMIERAARRRFLPTASLELGGEQLTGRGGAIVMLTLRWELDRDESAEIDRVADESVP
jgi:hypothetical protein